MTGHRVYALAVILVSLPVLVLQVLTEVVTRGG